MLSIPIVETNASFIIENIGTTLLYCGYDIRGETRERGIRVPSAKEWHIVAKDGVPER